MLALESRSTDRNEGIMRYRSLLRLLVLAEVSDDYEEVDHIFENVSARARLCQVAVQVDDVCATLADLVGLDLARAYRLSTTSPAVEVSIPLDRKQLKNYYFWITEKGKEWLHSSRDQWPFDEEDSLVPGWSLQADD